MVDEIVPYNTWPPPMTTAVRVGFEMAHFKRFLAPVLAGADELPAPLTCSLTAGYEIIDEPPQGSLSRRIRRRIDLLRVPYVTTVREFARPGVKFEIRSPVERHRVVEHGGETRYTRQMMAALQPHDVLWDVGVCVGMVALHAARRCTVVGFEPDPDIRGRFSRNLELNPDLTVDLHPYALSDDDGTATFYLGDATSSSLVGQRGETRSVEVETRTIDSLVFNDGLAAPTVVKLDIEGAELPALQGAESLLGSEKRPRLLFLEIHPEFLPAFGGTAVAVLDMVNSAGYYPTWAAARAGQIHMILRAN